MNLIKHELREILFFYGYTNHPNHKSQTAFFDFDEFTKEDLEGFNKFLQMNEEMFRHIEEPREPIVF